MVSGKPYISVNSATMKAEKAPKERQSRAVPGLVKLKAKMMKTSQPVGTPLPPHVGVNFRRFSNAELTITESELKAMAAAAMMGFKNPKAATGIPMVL